MATHRSSASSELSGLLAATSPPAQVVSRMHLPVSGSRIQVRGSAFGGLRQARPVAAGRYQLVTGSR